MTTDVRTQAPQHAVQHCRELTRHHSRTFYFGSCFFPAQQRQAVWAVYAACRTGDDAVDEGDARTAAARLDTWWTGVERAFAGRPARDPVFTALAWAADTYPIPLGAFEELRDGLSMDLNGHAYREMQDLELYCRRVAGVVGFMIAPIGGYAGGDDTMRLALRLGQAMQLTNILRDVGEDAGRGRMYLPQSLLAAYGVREQDVLSGHLTPQYEALMRHLAGVARAWYAEGRAGIPRLHGRSRLAVGAAAGAYEGILDALERNAWDNFRLRAQVSSARKLLLVPSVWWQLRGAGGM